MIILVNSPPKARLYCLYQRNNKRDMHNNSQTSNHLILSAFRHDVQEMTIDYMSTEFNTVMNMFEIQNQFGSLQDEFF